MEFYNVKKREHVTIDDKKCQKIIYTKETTKGIQYRYAARATDNGTNLTKFISKETYDKLTCPAIQK